MSSRVVDAIAPVPVVAAGGIADGRGVVLRRGAGFVTWRGGGAPTGRTI